MPTGGRPTSSPAHGRAFSGSSRGRPALFCCGDWQRARPLRRNECLPQCSDTVLGGWQDRAVPGGIEITEPRGRIVTHLGERPVDEVEAFEELGDILQTSTT